MSYLSNRTTSVVLWMTAAGVFAACASETEYAPGPPQGSPGSGSASGDGDDPVALGGDTGGPIGAAGDFTGDGDGGGDGDDPFANLGGAATGPDDPDAPPPLCSLGMSWTGENALASLNTAADESLLSITGDELAVVFTRDGTPYLAERADAADDWGVATELVLPVGFDSTLGLSLSPDALTLILVRDEGAGLGSVGRAARQTAFEDEVSESPFTVINHLVEMTSVTIGYPVLSDDSELWWVEFWEDSAVYNGEFDPEKVLTRSHVGCTQMGACDLLLDGSFGFDKSLTGISADHRTVFIDDELEGPRMLWRASTEKGYGFLIGVSLGDRLNAQPNDDCSRLYYEKDGELYFDVASP